jgi:hypothetical protein
MTGIGSAFIEPPREFDRDKLPASIDMAEKAINQRLRGLPIAHSKEHRKLRDALNSLAVLKRMV